MEGVVNTLLGRWRKSAGGFPVLTEPIEHQSWWFWGAALISVGMWCGLIYGACRIA